MHYIQYSYFYVREGAGLMGKKQFSMPFYLGAIIVLLASTVKADEIILKNGDKITGTIIEEDEASRVRVRTEAMGVVEISKNHVESYSTDEQIRQAKMEKESAWTRKISLGYSETGGNTEDSAFTGEARIHRKRSEDETTFRYNAYVSSSNDKQDARKFSAMGRYARSFGDEKEWFRFITLEGSQDRFSNIDYRIVPSAGVGYWFIDEPDHKFMTELSAGVEHTSYRNNTDSETEAVLIPHGYYEKLLFNDLRFSEDLTLYPSLSELGDFRLRTETAISQPLNEQMNWKLSYISEYDSDPAGNTKKMDYRFISSLEYTF